MKVLRNIYIFLLCSMSLLFFSCEKKIQHSTLIGMQEYQVKLENYIEDQINNVAIKEHSMSKVLDIKYTVDDTEEMIKIDYLTGMGGKLIGINHYIVCGNIIIKRIGNFNFRVDSSHIDFDNPTEQRFAENIDAFLRYEALSLGDQVVDSIGSALWEALTGVPLPAGTVSDAVNGLVAP